MEFRMQLEISPLANWLTWYSGSRKTLAQSLNLSSSPVSLLGRRWVSVFLEVDLICSLIIPADGRRQRIHSNYPTLFRPSYVGLLTAISCSQLGLLCFRNLHHVRNDRFVRIEEICCRGEKLQGLEKDGHEVERVYAENES